MASSISAGTTSSTALVATADTTGALQLATNNGTVAVTIDTSQNVGVGTTSPDSSNKLQVAGDFAVSWDANKFMGMKFGAGSAYKMGMMLNNTTRECKVWSQSSDSDDKITFYTGSTPSERMRINSSGNVLVGATSGGGKLSITGTGSSGWVQNNINSGTASTASIVFTNDNGAVGSILTSGSTTTYSTSSDYRLKEDIAPMTGALAKVAALKPVTYKWKVDGTDGQGFIAHELAEVVPQCVIGEKDAVDADGNPVYQGIDTSFLVATLTAAIQELNAKVIALEAKVGTPT